MSDLATARDPEVQRLLDKQAISDVIMRYCRGVDRFDAEIVASVYHPDAVDDHGTRVFRGPNIGEEIVEWMRPVAKVLTHHIGTQNIEFLDSDTAASESYSTGWHINVVDGEERPMQTVGRYIDRLERRNGRDWKIAHRVFVMEMSRYVPTGDLPSLADVGRARHDHSDPSYTVFAGGIPPITEMKEQ